MRISADISEPADRDYAASNPALHPDADELLDDGTCEGDEKKEPQEVREETRGHEKRTPDQYHGAVKEFRSRQATAGQFRLNAAQDGETLVTDKKCAGNAYEKKQGDCRHCPDQAADFDDDIDFDNGYYGKKKNEFEKHDITFIDSFSMTGTAVLFGRFPSSGSRAFLHTNSLQG
jgi:hypothetical protein